jgi:hypothetical protein
MPSGAGTSTSSPLSSIACSAIEISSLTPLPSQMSSTSVMSMPWL